MTPCQGASTGQPPPKDGSNCSGGPVDGLALPEAETLQRIAEHLSRSFHCWHLQHDKRRFATLGSGTLEIDLLTGSCRFGGRPVPALVIGGVLRRGLTAFVRATGVAPDTIVHARLSVQLAVDEHSDQKDKSVMWFGEHDRFIGCKMDVRSEIGTAERSYTAEHRGYAEWPC